MSLSKFFNNRFNILYIIVLVIIIILSFRLATLTIVEGEKYRETADVKKIKDIPIKAPRGKIYDRNGVLLADNLTSFTVQLYKNKIKQDNFNEVVYTLTKILDENGESLIDEFPIVLDTFAFNKKNDETTNTATDYVINILLENKLINEWLNSEALIYDDTYNVKERVILFLQKEYSDFPLELVDNNFQFVGDTEKVKEFLVNNEIDENMSPNGLVEYLLETENRFLLNLLSNSKTRRYTYEFLNKKGLVNDITLVEYAFIQDQKYEALKSSLSSNYEGITETSTAKEDFIYLTKYYVFDYLFNTVYGEENSKVIPGEILLEKLLKVYKDLPVTLKETDGVLTYEYVEGGNKQKYIDELKLESTTSAYELVKTLALKEGKIINDIIVNDISYYAQSELLNNGINPNISISAWEYTPLYEKSSWISSNVGKVENVDAEEIFNKLKEDIELEEDINDYDVRNILVVRDRYKKQGYLSYHPIDICYDVSEKTVAMVSERNHELSGINVEIEPIRYYPGKSLASHILGYLGKISQETEIEEYIVKNGDKYSLDDIIGKTGIEEKFESYLAGQKGKKTVAVNNLGNTIESVAEVAPVPGDNLYLTIDSRLQAKAEEVLEKGLKALQEGGTYESEWGNYKFKDPYKNATSASLVALDVKTGEVLALANYPSYDLNLFATGISTEDWNSLSNDSKDPLAPRPLYNTALLTAIQPGSTFKMVTALAALEKGIDPNAKVYCAGVMEVGQRKFGCWIYNMRGGSHGYQTMYEAIKNSCNFYFWTSMLGENPATGQKHGVQLDFEDVTDMATKFGLNDPTGIEIDIPKEVSGKVPNLESKKSSMRLYLRLFLEENLQYYVKDDYKMDSEELVNAINTIVGWLNEDILTRGEVYKRLEDLNFDPNKTHNYKEPLVDTIKYTYINHSVWNAGDSLNLSIGQGGNSYTPIQMANYVATIANGGYKHNVSVIDKLETYDGSQITYLGERTSERIELKNYDSLEVLKKGMHLVANDTIVYKTLPVKVGVKTGTAQKDGINPETGQIYDDFAWYVAFAPYDDPQIAISCVIFQGGTGTHPAPMVRDVIAEYLTLNGTLQRPGSEKKED